MDATLVLVRHRRLKVHPLRVSHKQDPDRGFILLLPQAAVLRGSDSGGNDVESTSRFVIQSCQTSCSMWHQMCGARY